MAIDQRTRHLRRLVSTLAFAVLSSARAALAAEGDAGASEPAPARFGGRGQVALDNLIGLTAGGGYLGPDMIAGIPYDSTWGATGYTGAIGYTHSNVRGGMPGTASIYAMESHTAWVSPSVDVFVADGLSIGATVGFSYSAYDDARGATDGMGTSPDAHSTTFSAVPRVGYAFALNEPLALWPRAGFGYSATRAEQAGRIAMNAWIGVVDLGLVYRPTKHVYLHVAPEVVLRVSSMKGASGTFQENSSLNFGFTGGLGILLNS
ncbi:hypothetical protein ACMHYB_15085 [Sorangium sp. So ce1128]